MHVTALEDIRDRLDMADTIAVLGAHSETSRPAFYVPYYLQRKGYRVLPVNPHLAGQKLFGEIVVPTLADLIAPCDMIDVFRKPAALMDHLPEILAMAPPPRTVWLQLGIHHTRFAAALVADGFDVIQDRCTYADHKMFGLPPK